MALTIDETTSAATTSAPRTPMACRKGLPSEKLSSHKAEMLERQALNQRFPPQGCMMALDLVHISSVACECSFQGQLELDLIKHGSIKVSVLPPRC